jgi:F0F1-type ATP synthase delta subunit
MPTYDLINQVLYLFPKTNRFVIEDNIREYNSILRRTEKKYYVMNKRDIEIISFFRKNNKILLNFMNLSIEEKTFFLMEGIFEDVLKNTEVIALSKKIYDEKIEVLDKWKGNVIIVDKNDNV